jgi:DNA repair protein RadC
VPTQLTLPSVTHTEYAWPAEASRPKHRLREAGPDALSDAELIAVVLGMDGAEGVRRVAGLLQQTGGLAGLRSYSLQSFARELGTDVRAGKLGAVLELARRMFRGSSDEPPTIRCPQDAALLLIPEIGHLEQEQLRVLLLNTRHQVLRQVLVYCGNVNTSMIRVAEVFREAVREGCPCILVGHNHPSHDPTPSPVMWRKFQKAMRARLARAA